MMEKFEITRLGDVLSWYYGDQFLTHPSNISRDPKSESEISEEIINFEKLVLQELRFVQLQFDRISFIFVSGKNEISFGLTDFIITLLQPAWIWESGLEFPRLYSWNKDAVTDIHNLFQYNTNASSRGNLLLETPDFQTDPQLSTLDGYNQLSKNVPDLDTTMQLMGLALNPSKTESVMFENLKSFNLSTNELTDYTMIPFCLFGKDSINYWNLRDYKEIDAQNNIPLKQFQEDYNLKEGDFYKYPKCKLFSPKPSQSGVCYTFNSLDLEKILKTSNWTKSFLNTFKEPDDRNIKKSAGIDLENGFVFTVDMMNSYLHTLKDRSVDQRKINSFWIKVHPSGEIPWIEKDRSTWKKITAFQNDMSTRFVSIKGEIISYEVKDVNI